jgi:hypothetical protein
MMQLERRRNTLTQRETQRVVCGRFFFRKATGEGEEERRNTGFSIFAKLLG